MKDPVTLIVIDGDADHKDQAIPVRGSEFVVGRAASCDLAIDHSRVSMQHCRIVRQGMRLSIHDLRSTYGTTVNGREVQTAELNDGDLIRVGPATLLVAIGNEPSESRRKTFAALAELRGRGVLEDPISRGRDPNDDTPLVETARRIFERVATKKSEEREREREHEPSEPEPAEVAPAPTLGGRRRSNLQLRRDESGIAIVELLDRSIIQDNDIFQINRDLDGLIAQGHLRMVLDFGNVRHLSSQALGILLQAQKRCKAAGGLMKVCNPNPEVAEIFKIANLRRAVEIYADEDQALESDWPDAPPPAQAPAPVVPTGTTKPAPGPRPAALSTLQVQLTLEVGRAKGKQIIVQGPRYVIGRDPRCQLRPASEAISRVHTRIDQREGRVFVRDMGTTNGTLLGERLLQGEEAEAHDGDRLQIGPLEFTLSIKTLTAAPPVDEVEDAAASWLFQGPAGTDPAPGDTALHPLVPGASSIPAPPAARPKPPTDFKRLQTQVVGEALLVTILSSELVDEEQIGPVRHELIALLEQPVPKRLVIKLDRVSVMSSLAVAMFLSHFQRLDRLGGGLRLCRVRDEVFPALENLLSSGVISIYPSPDHALKDPWPIT